MNELLWKFFKNFWKFLEKKTCLLRRGRFRSQFDISSSKALEWNKNVINAGRRWLRRKPSGQTGRFPFTETRGLVCGLWSPFVLFSRKPSTGSPLIDTTPVDFTRKKFLRFQPNFRCGIKVSLTCCTFEPFPGH